jgi:hypothetical protein
MAAAALLSVAVGCLACTIRTTYSQRQFTQPCLWRVSESKHKNAYVDSFLVGRNVPFYRLTSPSYCRTRPDPTRLGPDPTRPALPSGPKAAGIYAPL